MSENQLTQLYAGTAMFGFLLVILPICVRKGPNQGIIQCSMLISVVSMWIFWATVYIAQMHPLIGPRHKNTTLIWYKQAESSDTLRARSVPTPEKRGNNAKQEEKEHEKVDETAVLRSRPSHCHDQPDNLFECCNIPWLPKRAKAKCIGDSVDILKLTCPQARCAFQDAGWLERPGVVKMADVVTFYDRLEKNDPDWAHAVRLIKEECLQSNLKYQGVYTDCPEYDIMYCAMIRLFKHAPLLNWSTAAACVPTQEFIGSCPVCPVDCNWRTLKDKSESAPRCQACLTF